MVASLAVWPSPLESSTGLAAGPPNILIIVTDDQRSGLTAMPATRRLFKRQGVQYRRGYTPIPVCCPARASIMTGQYPHNHRVKANKGLPDLGLGGAKAMDASTTIQHYLDEAGYTTGLVGKYLNSWNMEDAPPSFDDFAMIHTRNYLNSVVSVGQAGETPTTYRSGSYNTSLVSRRALRFLRHNSDPSTPFFLYVAPFAPHGPFTPQPRYAGDTFGRWDGNPAVFEKDRSDKPAYVQAASATIADGRRTRTAQLRTLESVDDMVESIFEQLRSTGQAQNTLAFFVSDNGYLWGEHGRLGKTVPYAAAIEVPFYARWPAGPLVRGTVDRRGAANIDIAPTIMGAVGLTVPPSQPPMDGRSLLDAWERTRQQTEHWCNISKCKFWAALRTSTYHYVEYYDGPDFETAGVTFREYYDLENDPFELVNLLNDGDPANDPDLGPIAAQLAADRTCAGAACP